MNSTTDYNERSLQHERHMLDLYRKRAASDGSLLQPLANACWRAAAFEWQTHQDAEAVLSLWEEAARTLSEGFTKKPLGFERNPEQLLLAINFSIASRTEDVARTLLHVTTASTPGSRQQRHADAGMLLAKGYQSILRALAERRVEAVRNAQYSIEEARLGSNHNLSPASFSEKVDWDSDEQSVINTLLTVIANVAEENITRHTSIPSDYEREFGSLMDSTLLSLEQFCEMELDHRPKFYCWLPGVALTLLAADAGLPLGWLSDRYDVGQAGYERLPLVMVQKALARNH
jgi:hypothetical protein